MENRSEVDRGGDDRLVGRGADSSQSSMTGFGGATKLFFILSVAVDTGCYALIKMNKGKKRQSMKKQAQIQRVNWSVAKGELVGRW